MKKLIILLCLMMTCSAIQMLASENATVYLTAPAGEFKNFTITIFGNDENKPANVTLMLDGDVNRYVSVQQMIEMKANPNGVVGKPSTYAWYPIILTVMMPMNETKGDLYAVVKQCEGVAGACQEFAMMKHLVLRPKAVEKVILEEKITPKNETISDVKPITSENAHIDNFEYAPVGLLFVIFLIIAVAIIIFKPEREVRKDEKRRD